MYVHTLKCWCVLCREGDGLEINCGDVLAVADPDLLLPPDADATIHDEEVHLGQGLGAHKSVATAASAARVVNFHSAGPKYLKVCSLSTSD